LRGFCFGGLLGDSLVPFITIKHQLEGLLNRKRVCYRESRIHAVRFCSMLPMRAIPAQVVVLMGMQEDAYPKQELPLSLNRMMGNKKVDYCPSQTDYDRSLFLETLLGARRYYLITYQGYSSQDGKEQPPSLLVTELLGYLDKAYLNYEKRPSECCVNHP